MKAQQLFVQTDFDFKVQSYYTVFHANRYTLTMPFFFFYIYIYILHKT